MSSPTASPRRLTQRRTLRRGRSLWTDSSGLGVPSLVPTRDIICDVAVVGAGISGALVAHRLVQRGLSVAVLDRRDLLHGSTIASTALLQFEIDLPLTVLAKHIGLRRAERAWRRSVGAVQALAALVARERIRCGFGARSSLYLAGDAYGARALRREVVARGRAGIPGRFVSAAELRARFGIDRTGAIESDGNAAADPAQLTAGLLRRVAAHGAHLYRHADVLDVSADATGVVLGLASGQSVIAGHAVFCTGYELLAQVPLAGHVVKSTWAMATTPMAMLPPWMHTTVVWEASDPYLYLRTTPDGRIVAGGEDEPSSTRFSDVGALWQKTHRIVDKLHTLLPDLRITPSHHWAGAFGESPTGLPIIDRVPGLRRCYNVTGFGGNGITHSVIASEVIAHAITGRPDRDRDLFRAPR
jgi:glycine/D-amino acid oxidase-like deaminating enzyme